MRPRARWLLLLTFLLLALLLGGSWIFGRTPCGSGPDATESATSIPPAIQDEPPLTPILVGSGKPAEDSDRRAENGSAEAIDTRFVLASTESPVPFATWQIRDDRLRPNDAGGWTFTGNEHVLFDGSADRDGRARLSASAVSAWREHEIFVHRSLCRVEVLAAPPAEQDGLVTIPVRLDGGVHPARFNGTVIDDLGRAVPGALLQFGDGSMEWWARADDQGRFDVAVPVDADDETCSLVAAAPGLIAREWDLPSTGTTDFEVRLGRDYETASVTLRVVEPDGTPASGAWLHVVPPEGDEAGSWKTQEALLPWFPLKGYADPEGRYVLHGLVVGDATVRAHNGVNAVVARITIVRPLTERVIRLEHGRELRGQVRLSCVGRCGASQHEMSIRVQSAGPRSVTWTPLCRRRLPVGPVRIEGLPSEALEMRLVIPGHPEREFTIEGRDGLGREPIDLGVVEVGPGRQVTVTVEHPDGTPVEHGYLQITCREVPREGGWISRGKARVRSVWDPVDVQVTRMRNRPDLDVTDQVDLDADEWAIVVPRE